MATKTHLLARDQAVVGLDEHVLGASQVHAARLQLGGVVHAGHDFLDLLGGNLRGREDAASDLVSGSTNTKHPTFVDASEGTHVEPGGGGPERAVHAADRALRDVPGPDQVVVDVRLPAHAEGARELLTRDARGFGASFGATRRPISFTGRLFSVAPFSQPSHQDASRLSRRISHQNGYGTSRPTHGRTRSTVTRDPEPPRRSITRGSEAAADRRSRRGTG